MIGLVGASGFLGWSLYNYLQPEVLGTYYNNPKPGLVKFDITKDYYSIFDKCSFVVIASAYKVKFCEENPQEAYDLNVYHTKRLLDYLHRNGIPSLFISSFSIIRPNTFYGICKIEVENYIKQEKLNSQYLRLDKITEENMEEWCMIIKWRIDKCLKS
jgi:dTDP-4-dehydrorhamnose reductase